MQSEGNLGFDKVRIKRSDRKAKEKGRPAKSYTEVLLDEGW